MRKSPIFAFSLALVLVLTVVAVIIYGFDISTPKNTRRALGKVVQNEGTTTRFYKVNETVAFGVFTDREPGEMDITLTTYVRNMVPYCFLCGWYVGDPDNDSYVSQPYMANGMAYGIEARDQDYGGVPAGEFPTFNFNTGEFGHVKDLSTITDDPTNVSKRITREYVSENYDEISWFGPDDEDCMAVYTALIICYVVLLIWGVILLFRRRKA